MNHEDTKKPSLFEFTPSRLGFWLTLIVLLWIAYALRVYKLDSVPLRGDEAYSVMHWTSTPFSDNWDKLIRREPARSKSYGRYQLPVARRFSMSRAIQIRSRVTPLCLSKTAAIILLD